MRRTSRRALGALAVALATLAAAGSAAAQEPPQETLRGARDYTRVDATVACAGATAVEALPELKRRGFSAVINFRTASEKDANLEAEAEAAGAAGLRYIHLPLSSTAPDPAVVEPFLKAATDPANQPVYIHCASANRVGALWLIKRVLIDGWTVEKATVEAEAIGLRSEIMRNFALDYVRARGK